MILRSSSVEIKVYDKSTRHVFFLNSLKSILLQFPCILQVSCLNSPVGKLMLYFLEIYDNI